MSYQSDHDDYWFDSEYKTYETPKFAEQTQLEEHKDMDMLADL